MSNSQSVLLVEDDAWQAEHFKRILSRAGYQVAVANTAQMAISHIDVARPDVIVLDLMLPGTNGIGLLHELRAYADTGDIPVIICSSVADNLSVDNLRPYGVIDMIDKTKIQPDEILVAVRGAIG